MHEIGLMRAALTSRPSPYQHPTGNRHERVHPIATQHHYAHIFSCITKHRLKPPALGIAWDGVGKGPDDAIWGGEFLTATAQGLTQLAHFLPYYLPGSDCCTLEPRRSALGLLYSCYGEAAFEMTDLAPMQAFKATQLVVLRKILTNKINLPATSSIRRLFDGVASLLNLQQVVSFEGQAALTLEFAATQSPVKKAYPFVFIENDDIQGHSTGGENHSQPILIDWRPMVRAIVEDCQNAVMTPVIAAKFHNTLVAIIVEMARRAQISQVILAGDCFQNTHLTESVIHRLSAEGFIPYWPQRTPQNDSDLAVGQVMAAWQYLSTR
ncbi:MAG: hypothetical protein AAGC93_23460 [Cyanobacteria bacterium P01_F01_bin.53]